MGEKRAVEHERERERERGYVSDICGGVLSRNCSYLRVRGEGCWSGF